MHRYGFGSDCEWTSMLFALYTRLLVNDDVDIFHENPVSHNRSFLLLPAAPISQCPWQGGPIDSGGPFACVVDSVDNKFGSRLWRSMRFAALRKMTRPQPSAHGTG